MKIINFSVKDFKPWSGAVEAWKRIMVENKVNELDNLLNELYPEGLTWSQLNDELWFNKEQLYSWLGI